MNFTLMLLCTNNDFITIYHTLVKNIKMTDEKLLKAERAIEDLADALGISEQEVVSIIREGMEAKSPIAN